MFQRRPLAPRAKVTPEFMDALARVYTTKYKDVVMRIKAGQNGEDLRMQARLLHAFLHSAEARERTIAKLASLPYEIFEYKEIRGKEFLYGKTRDIIMESSDYQGTCRYNIGPYWVLTNLRILRGGSVEDIHLIPDRFPKLQERHPHHYAYGDQEAPPTDWGVSTCLGSFAEILVMLRNIGDIPEWFRTWHIFLSRHDNTSNLCYPPMKLFGDPL